MPEPYCNRCGRNDCPAISLVRSAVETLERATSEERSPAERSATYLELHARADIACSLYLLTLPCSCVEYHGAGGLMPIGGVGGFVTKYRPDAECPRHFQVKP